MQRLPEHGSMTGSPSIVEVLLALSFLFLDQRIGSRNCDARSYLLGHGLLHFPSKRIRSVPGRCCGEPLALASVRIVAWM